LKDVVLNRPQAEILHKDAVKDLANEVSHVRKEVSREYKWMHGLGISRDSRRTTVKAIGSSVEISITLARRRRLLFLFVQDLSNGLSGEMLSMKSQRDSTSASSKIRARLEGVSVMAKVIGWIFVGLMNLGMLFYVYLFAMSQTPSRQSAWFRSFLMWLTFDFFIASTWGVVLTHLLIPMYVLADISKLKEKVLSDLLMFRERYNVPQDVEEGVGTNVEADPVLRLQVKERDPLFNAAKYLFVSWRVASLCRELPESQLILQFNTLWPKKKFGEKEAEVASEYEQDVLFNAVSQIVVFFLTSLLRCHTLLQDMILQTVCNSGFGLMTVGLIQLFSIHPVLPAVVTLVLMLFVGYLLRISSQWNNKMTKRLASVTPTPQHHSASLTQHGDQASPIDTPVLDPIAPFQATIGRVENIQKDEKEGSDEDDEENDSGHSDSSDSSDASDHVRIVIIPRRLRWSLHEETVWGRKERTNTSTITDLLLV
jgi:hypothetical protein